MESGEEGQGREGEEGEGRREGETTHAAAHGSSPRASLFRGEIKGKTSGWFMPFAARGDAGYLSCAPNDSIQP